MGAVLAKFKKEKTTTAVLEGLEEKIQQLEKYTLNTQEQKKRFVGNFLAISIGVYVIAFLVFYFVYFPPTWSERIIYFVPLFLFPLVIILLRKVFTWYFQRKLNKNTNKLTVLRAEKKKILEQVMDKETYKVAVNLLARFGGDRSNSNKYAMTPRAPSTTQNVSSLNQSMRQLASGNQLSASQSNMRTLNNSVVGTPRHVVSTTQLGSQTRQMALTPQIKTGQELRRRTPFPLINQQDKGVLERLVDALIGDGPQDRFAMICKDCFAHNGMALKEEFDYATFRCAFCNVLNHSRKARPVAPRLPVQQHGTPTRLAKDSSDSSSTSDDDSDKENIERRQAPKVDVIGISPSSAIKEEKITDNTENSGKAVEKPCTENTEEESTKVDE